MHSTLNRPVYDGSWINRSTPVVKALMLINAFTFLGQVLAAVIFKSSHFEDWFALSGAGIQQGHFWQIFTYMFLHGGPLHLVFNLVSLFFLGNEVEASIGSRRFLRLYLLGGAIGGLLWVSFYLNSGGMLVGASGGVYAVIVAFAALYPNRPITLLLFFILPVTLRAKFLGVGLVAISVFFSMTGGDGIAHLAHLGGAVVGFLFIQAMVANFKNPFQQSKVQKVTAPIRKAVKFPFPIGKKDEYMQKQIDPILDKIAEHGIQSLTKEERQLLNEAKDRLP